MLVLVTEVPVEETVPVLARAEVGEKAIAVMVGMMNEEERSLNRTCLQGGRTRAREGGGLCGVLCGCVCRFDRGT